MNDKTLKLLIVGIVSSVAAWAITSGLDKYMDKVRGRNARNDTTPRNMRRNKILAGAGVGRSHEFK